MNGKLKIGLSDPRDVSDMLKSGEYWAFCFGPSMLDLVDDLDEFLEDETMTVFNGLVMMTLLPKRKFKYAAVKRWLTGHGAGDLLKGRHADQDIFLIGPDEDQAALRYSLNMLPA